MNIFLHELRSNLKSLLIWSAVIILLITIAVAKFSAYAANPEALEVVNNMPKPLLEAFNMHAFNLTTLEGFSGVLFVYFGLMGAMAAAMWGSDIISKEERNKTVEFLLALPVTRSRVVTAKALAALVNCIAFVLITWIASLVAVRPYNPSPAMLDFLALEMQAMFMIELIFLAVGLLLGCAMKRYKLAGSVAIGVILTTFFIGFASGLHEKLAFLKWFTPFKYFDAADIFHKGRLDSTYLLISALIIVASIVMAYRSYNHRDLYV